MDVEDSRTPLTAERLAALVGGHAALNALSVTGTTSSTNSELLKAIDVNPHAWPHLSALVADHQTAGRGRAGRDWFTPRGAALTVSYVLRPVLPADRWGLVPLAVGLAAVRTLRAEQIDAYLKWPNDVVVQAEDDAVPGWGSMRKVAGVLCERRGDAVVSGIGVNVSQSPDELPVPHAASLATLGARRLDRAVLLEALSAHVGETISELEADPDAFVEDVSAVIATLGMEVVAELPGRPPVTGEATALAPDGSLLIRTSSGAIESVSAGDVRLRARPQQAP